jgi:hypothetical protein
MWELAAAVQRVGCQTCRRPATGFYASRALCTECRAQVIALQQLWDGEGQTEQQKREALRQDELTGMQTPALDGYRLRLKLGRWLWAPTLLAVGGALWYMGWLLGYAVLTWIRSGGAN